jgi:hypothetical protein
MAFKLTNREFSLRFLVLTLIERSPKSELSTKQIIEIAEHSDWITQFERTSVNSRSDSRIANKINNITCHIKTPTNMLQSRLIVRIAMADGGPGFALTNDGKNWLAKYRDKLGIVDSTNHQAVNELLCRLRDLRK